MCGIAGFLFRRDRPSAEEQRVIAKAMADRLWHRGPDGDGVWLDAERGVGFGHRRLAIVDLSEAGKQPMISGSGRYVITYNGEIYNFRKLRRELEGRDYAFRGHSDTEVLLGALDCWGLEDALERINGMFAFALWDKQEGSLILARDRVGKKPLYYGWNGRAFLFGSELKALRAHPDFEDSLDLDALGLFVQYGWLAQPYSIFGATRKLPAGTYLKVSARVAPWSAAPQVYWSAREVAERQDSAPFTGSFEDARDRLESLLRTAVSERMVADVSLGALLSGGLDSSTVVALMQSVADRPVKTFSIGVPDSKHNEAQEAAAIAAHLGTEHRELYVTPEQCLDVVESLPQIYDEPFADISQVPTFLVSKLARQEVTVALSGDGGDELFSGYTRYFDGLDRWQAWGSLPLGLRRTAGCLADFLARMNWRLVAPAEAERATPLPAWQRYGGKLERRAFFWTAKSPEELLARALARHPRPSDLVPDSRPTAASLSTAKDWAGLGSPLRRMCFLDYVTYLNDDVLAKVDRASMAVSLEVRCPILDRRVTEFAWSLPSSFLIDAEGGKRILRAVLARHVPKALTDRPKRGFSVPLDEWLRGPLRSWAEDLLSEASLQRQGLFNPAAVQVVWKQHLCRWRNQVNLLWAILMFQSWWHKQTRPIA